MLPIAMPPMVMSTALKTALASSPSMLGLVGDILRYRQAARELRLEERRIDAEFALRSHQLESESRKAMAELQLLYQRCENHYRALGQESAQQHTESMARASDRKLILMQLVLPGLSTEERAGLLEVLNMFNQLDRDALSAATDRLALRPEVTLDR